MAVFTTPAHSKMGWSFAQHTTTVQPSPKQWEMAPFLVNTIPEQQQAAHIVIKELMRFFSMTENDTYYDQSLSYNLNYSTEGRDRLGHRCPGLRHTNETNILIPGSDFDWESPINPTNWNGESFEVLVGVGSNGAGVFITYAQQKSSVFGAPSMYLGVNPGGGANTGFVNGGVIPTPSNLFTAVTYVRPSNSLFNFTAITPMILPLIVPFSVNERQS